MTAPEEDRSVRNWLAFITGMLIVHIIMSAWGGGR